MEDKKLPVLNTLLKSILLPAIRIKDVIRLTSPYIVLSLIGAFLFEDLVIFSSWAMFGYWLVSMFVTILAAVNCHRVFLLNPEHLLSDKIFSWDKHNTLFLRGIIVLVLMSMLVAMPYGLLTIGVFIDNETLSQAPNNPLFFLYLGLFYLPIGYLISRWSLILPDAAVGEGRGTGWSWHISAGNSIRLFVLISAIPFTFGIGLAYLSVFLSDSFIGIFLSNILMLVITVFELCLLSLSYAFLTDFNKNSSHDIDLENPLNEEVIDA